jgi:hypothetical protein
MYYLLMKAVGADVVVKLGSDVFVYSFDYERLCIAPS